MREKEIDDDIHSYENKYTGNYHRQKYSQPSTKAGKLLSKQEINGEKTKQE